MANSTVSEANLPFDQNQYAIDLSQSKLIIMFACFAMSLTILIPLNKCCDTKQEIMKNKFNITFKAVAVSLSVCFCAGMMLSFCMLQLIPDAMSMETFLNWQEKEKEEGSETVQGPDPLAYSFSFTMLALQFSFFGMLVVDTFLKGVRKFSRIDMKKFTDQIKEDQILDKVSKDISVMMDMTVNQSVHAQGMHSMPTKKKAKKKGSRIKKSLDKSKDQTFDRSYNLQEKETEKASTKSNERNETSPGIYQEQPERNEERTTKNYLDLPDTRNKGPAKKERIEFEGGIPEKNLKDDEGQGEEKKR